MQTGSPLLLLLPGHHHRIEPAAGRCEMGMAMASLLAMASNVNVKSLIILSFIPVKSHLEIHRGTLWGRTWHEGAWGR
jgi:hypothetical protein